MKGNRKKEEDLRKRMKWAAASPARPAAPRTSPENFHSLEILCAHAARTLPDSLSGRKRLLAALVNVMRTGHPASRQVLMQMILLRGFERMQSELVETFQENERQTPATKSRP